MTRTLRSLHWVSRALRTRQAGPCGLSCTALTDLSQHCAFTDNVCHNCHYICNDTKVIWVEGCLLAVISVQTLQVRKKLSSLFSSFSLRLPLTFVLSQFMWNNMLWASHWQSSKTSTKNTALIHVITSSETIWCFCTHDKRYMKATSSRKRTLQKEQPKADRQENELWTLVLSDPQQCVSWLFCFLSYLHCHITISTHVS